MSVEDNIEVVRRLGEALSDRDWPAFDALVAEDCEWEDVPTGRSPIRLRTNVEPDARS